jgi:hypothetical protein
VSLGHTANDRKRKTLVFSCQEMSNRRLLLTPIRVHSRVECRTSALMQGLETASSRACIGGSVQTAHEREHWEVDSWLLQQMWPELAISPVRANSEQCSCSCFL